MTSAKELAYFRGECKTSKVADAEPDCLGAVLLQSQEGEWRAVSYALHNLTESKDGTLRQKRKPSLWYAHVNGSTCTCMGVTSH